MNIIRGAINQPVTVVVGVVLTIMAGLVAIQRIPVQLTPTVEDTIISVSTYWEGASPSEVEQDIIDKQEEKLQGIANLRTMTSTSQQSRGVIRLEFEVGTDKNVALREVSDKLREVPEYPDNVDEPVVEASDPENRDYIAWVIFGTTDPTFDVRTLQDFAEDRIKPVLERIPGMSEIEVLGGREREAQIRFDPVRLAQRGITPMELVQAIDRTNRDISAGEIEDAKRNIRVRTLSQYDSVEDVKQTIVKYTDAGPILLGEVADVVETYKEPFTFVRSKGEPVIAINAQREVGTNVKEVMDGLKAELARLNAPGGMLDAHARKLGLNGKLELTQVYDQTIYIDQALRLVNENIIVGGALAFIALMIFLRSLRSVLIIIVSTPISVVGAIVAMVALGRTINVISLAGMAFAIGMVIDNAIVILENIFRHLEMGKKPFAAAYDGTREVWGAILAATLTNVIVFVPILLIQEEAGQLFRDIALAVCATAILSLIVCMLVVPMVAARLMKTVPKAMRTHHEHEHGEEAPTPRKHRPLVVRILLLPISILMLLLRGLDALPDLIAGLVHRMTGSVIVRVLVVLIITAVSLIGSYMLMPPADYLPKGNRNLVFGLIIPPPGYNLKQQESIGRRVEETIRPFWEAAEHPVGSKEYEEAKAKLPEIPNFNFWTQQMEPPVVPPPIENYFFVAFDGIMFHGAIAAEEKRAVDVALLLNHATRTEVVPGVMPFAFQVPLFQLGGSSGSAVKINFSGDDLDVVSRVADKFYQELSAKYGAFTVQPEPSNFNIPGPEIHITPNRRRLNEVNMTASDLGLAVQAFGDGAIIGEYRVGGETIDLKLIAEQAVDREVIDDLGSIPVATPVGSVVPLFTLADITPATSAPQINRVNRQRAVTLQFTAPMGMPLEQAIAEVDAMISAGRADGTIPPDVLSSYTGSASKLKSVQRALLGDGGLVSTLNSSLVLALLMTYLLMCVLYQSFMYPLVIMFTVPLATLGGFAALFGMFIWSLMDRYVPVQMMDVLTMLGFIILVGVVVNNAILIVHQTINFMEGKSDVEGRGRVALPPREAITESVRTRIRPIFMSTFTSVMGMLPLVVMPGAGSELYRGLGSVVVGGLLLSTVFTLILIPLLLSLAIDLKMKLGFRSHEPEYAVGGAATAPMRSPEQ